MLKQDLTGQRFGRLVVVRYAGTKQSGNQQKIMWLCKCDCGNEKEVLAASLKSGHTVSCGCYHKEKIGALNRTHNMANKQRLYRVWKGMRERCNNPNNKRFKNYGGRGIKVCDEWQNDYLAFHTWAMANGYKEDILPNGLNRLTIDRIDVNGNYEPNNCRFVTNAENAKNKRKSL